MQLEFESYLKDKFPYLLTESSVLCCSGGVDSVVLFHLMLSVSKNFVVAHCKSELNKPICNMSVNLPNQVHSSGNNSCDKAVIPGVGVCGYRNQKFMTASWNQELDDCIYIRVNLERKIHVSICVFSRKAGLSQG